jgi:hypothetical protein
MSLLVIPSIPLIPGLQAALDGKAALSGADFTGAVSLGGGTSEFSGLGLGTAYSQRLNSTWANPATEFTALQVNVTDAASAAESKLADWKVGGVSKASVRKDGQVKAVSFDASSHIFSSGNIRTPAFFWASNLGRIFFGDGQDVGLFRYAANVLEVNNGTAGQRRDLMLRSLWDSGGNQVVGSRQSAVADATDAATVITQLNALLAKLRTHGLIAP